MIPTRYAYRFPVTPPPAPPGTGYILTAPAGNILAANNGTRLLQG